MGGKQDLTGVTLCAQKSSLADAAQNSDLHELEAPWTRWTRGLPTPLTVKGFSLFFFLFTQQPLVVILQFISLDTKQKV